MGPRIDRPRKGHRRRCSSHERHGFNGAAIDRSRKVLWCVLSSGGSPGFNGAAIDRARKGAHVIPGRIVATMLQWGRGSIDRGKQAARRINASSEVASMGPRSIDRGKGRISRPRFALADASMGPRSIDRGKETDYARAARLSARFNGAAIVRSRKGPRTAVSPREPSALQWGRDRSIAESGVRSPVCVAQSLSFNGAADRSIAERLIAVRRGNRHRVPASMGPRSIDRGKLAIPSEARAATPLQWGRDRSIAERRAMGRKAQAERLRFNGAAIDRSRKVAATAATDYGANRASMGPRSIDRGKRIGRVPSRLTGACFNGAAIDRSRKALYRRASRLRPTAGFNGAADRSIAESNEYPDRDWASLAGFNGAAIDRSRKGRITWRSAAINAMLQWGRDR